MRLREHELLAANETLRTNLDRAQNRVRNLESAMEEHELSTRQQHRHGQGTLLDLVRCLVAPCNCLPL